MNNTEAKFILNAYRPNGRDANDATFSAALAQAKSDPALSVWFAREQAHGAAVAAKLHEVVPPAGLREAILAGGRVSGEKLSAPVTTQRSFWNRPVWLAAAAAPLSPRVRVSLSVSRPISAARIRRRRRRPGPA